MRVALGTYALYKFLQASRESSTQELVNDSRDKFKTSNQVIKIGVWNLLDHCTNVLI